MFVAAQNLCISCPSWGVAGIVRAITKRPRARILRLLRRLRNVIRITGGVNGQRVQNLSPNLLRVQGRSAQCNGLESAVNQVAVQLPPLDFLGDSEELQHAA